VSTAVDGRQVTANVTADVLYKNTCIGTTHGADLLPEALSFNDDASAESDA
jgi:hypothetical protein